MLELITAIIKPHQLDAVKEALLAAGAEGMTVTEVRGFGRQRGKTENFRGSEYKIDFLPKLRLEIVVESTETERLVNLIADSARTGKIGDGKIWTSPIGSLLRVRTGETGSEAV